MNRERTADIQQSWEGTEMISRPKACRSRIGLEGCTLSRTKLCAISQSGALLVCQSNSAYAVERNSRVS